MSESGGIYGRRVGIALAVILGGAAVVAVILVLQASPEQQAPAPGSVKALPGGNGYAKPSATGWPPPAEIPQSPATPLADAAGAAGCELLSPPNEGNRHTGSLDDRITYKANPPTSGAHFLVPAEDGAYLVAPQTEQTVHSLEHGRIDIQWNPKTAATDRVISGLKALYDRDPYHLLLFPNQTAMPYAVAATAWDHALVCKTVEIPAVYTAINAFIDTYRDKGPEKVP